ncbi:hypothetical protein RFI_13472 [Reticulomyxa filosa]|uniref:Actin-related protein 2/3 complex subunit 5 n=1 Tax=Reticulomyxa filosa TaxID=46433 RepID=X6NCI2_RETFI|nr:hypothetical protein RFI_13472 [Reticulomyxa filosa]|eukprot:ETO23706.1 hypothetical protein RFI_13472 [Reticulomyxa filosa]
MSKKAFIKKKNFLFKEFAEPVLEALRSSKKSDIGTMVDKLEEHEREVILKYVYYGFQAKSEHAETFLSWQQAIVKKDGLGAIVRILSDIKRNILDVKMWTVEFFFKIKKVPKTCDLVRTPCVPHFLFNVTIVLRNTIEQHINFV